MRPLSDDRLVQPDQAIDGDVAKLEVGRAAAVHQAEGDRLAVVRDVGDLVGGCRVFALDKIPVLGRACGKVKFWLRRLRLAFGSHLRSVTLCFAGVVSVLSPL